MNAELKISGQKSVPLNDIEACWMYNKKNKAEISYNLQTCVDCVTHLIVATYISQNPPMTMICLLLQISQQNMSDLN